MTYLIPSSQLSEMKASFKKIVSAFIACEESEDYEPGKRAELKAELESFRKRLSSFLHLQEDLVRLENGIPSIDPIFDVCDIHGPFLSDFCPGCDADDGADGLLKELD